MINKKILFENLASLYLVQIANYLLPLVTLPYLVRVLGIVNFGLLSFAYAFIQYFVVFIDYGYNLTATREISIHREDDTHVSKIFCTVMVVKLAFLAISVGIIAILVDTVPKFHAEWKLYSICFLAVLGNYLFPVWFLQGIEKIKSMAVINLAAKIVTTALIFALVKSQNDILIAALLQTGSVMIAAVASMIYIYSRYPIKIMWPGIGNIIASLKEGWAIFVTIISSTLLGNTNIFILGLLCDNQSVGYYAIADKIIRAFINIVNPISVAIFPITSKMISQSKEAGVRFVRRVLLIGSFPFVAIVAAIFILAGAMVSIISGHQSQPIIILLRIMAVLPLTIFIDNLYGTQILVNIGRREQFMKAVLYPGIFSLLSSLLLVPIWKEQATAVIYVVSEIAVLTIMVYFVKCEGIYLIADGVI